MQIPIAIALSLLLAGTLWTLHRTGRKHPALKSWASSAILFYALITAALLFMAWTMGPSAVGSVLQAVTRSGGTILFVILSFVCLLAPAYKLQQLR